MASKYRKISVGIWNDAAFRSYSDKAKLIFFMLLTHPHTTPVGALRANVPGLACEMGWDEKGFREGFREVLSKGRVKYDERASLIWLPRFLKHNAPENPNVFKSWIQGFKELPECQLKCEIDQEVKAFVEGLSEGFREVFRKCWPKGMPNQEQEQEQYTGDKENRSQTLPSFSENPEAGASPAQEDPPKRPRKKREKPTFAEDSFEYKAAAYLFEGILKLQPDFKPQNLQEWASHIDMMKRIDGRTEDGIRKVLQKIHSGYWYAPNVQCGRKLREKYDTIMAHIVGDETKAKQGNGNGAGNSKQGTTCTGQPRFKGFDENSERDYAKSSILNDHEKLKRIFGEEKYAKIMGHSIGNGDDTAAGQ